MNIDRSGRPHSESVFCHHPAQVSKMNTYEIFTGKCRALSRIFLIGKAHTLQTEWECERIVEFLSSFIFYILMLVSTTTKSFCTNLSFSLVSTLSPMSLCTLFDCDTRAYLSVIFDVSMIHVPLILPYFLRSTNFHYSLSPPHKIF